MGVQASEQERALREFVCKLCSGVLTEPVSAPCSHHFCRPCLEKHFQVSHNRNFMVDMPSGSLLLLALPEVHVHACHCSVCGLQHLGVELHLVSQYTVLLWAPSSVHSII